MKCFFVSSPRTYLSLHGDLNFRIHIGIHPSNTGDKLVYYYLYHEEAPFPLKVCPQPFKYVFSYFYTNTIFIHLSSSLQ